MALRAGAELFNMEFIQQGLATTWPVQAMVMLYEMPEPYRMVNRHGKSFIQEYLPPGTSVEEVSNLKAYHWPVSCRDAAIHLDRAIYGEALAGRATDHDAVFLDLAKARRGFQPEMFIEYMASKGIDVARDLLQIQIHHHTQNGGVRIDSRCHSRVQGLFACGEACGYQGADRLGGTMLGGSQVFGWRAGRAAAEISKERPDPPGASSEAAEARIAAIRGAGTGRQRAQDLLPELQRAMWRLLLVERSAERLAAARERIAEERDRLANDLAIAEPTDLIAAIEHHSLLDVAEVIVETADRRKESRGSHYRSDFPRRDDGGWLTNQIVTRDAAGALRIERRWVAEDNGWIDQPGDVRIKPWG
jgi:L-aspartate oxidase